VIIDNTQLSNLIKRELLSQKTNKYYAYLNLFRFFHYSYILYHTKYVFFYLFLSIRRTQQNSLPIHTC